MSKEHWKNIPLHPTKTTMQIGGKSFDIIVSIGTKEKCPICRAQYPTVLQDNYHNRMCTHCSHSWKV